MNIREHKGFQIQIMENGSGYIAEIYRNEKLVKIVRGEDEDLEENPFCSVSLAFEAAKGWIDLNYRHRLKYLGSI
jgi:hypothetical protein